MNNDIHDDLVSIEGYAIRRRDRNRHGGGVAIYTRNLFMINVNSVMISPCHLW